ncbi:TPA: hypothetical protein AB5C29_002827 [Vibrio cholerae]
MHDYAIFGHSRATIGRWLGVASVILTGAVSSLLVWLYEATNIEAFATAIITPAIIYFVLHYCFDRFGWKIPLKAITIRESVFFVGFFSLFNLSVS